MNKMRCDFETRSDVDLKTRGSPLYFASPNFKALILSYKIDNRPKRRWTYDQPLPDDLGEFLESDGLISAWNCSFERQGFNTQAERFNWPRPALTRYRCTAAEAAAMGLPRSLDAAAAALGLSIGKDKRGAALIRKFSIPRRPRKDEDPFGIYWNEPEDHPEDFNIFGDYCGQDVDVEEAVGARTIPLSVSEIDTYHLDQIINDRGLRIDRQSCVAAIELVEKAKATLDAEIKIVTSGSVTACSQVAKLTEWVQNQYVPVTGLAKNDITEALSYADLPGNVQRALELRQEAAKTSTSKLKAFLNSAGADDRVRHAFLYHAAGTGRWSSLRVNFGNMPRPRPQFADAKLDPAPMFRAFRQREPDLLKLMYGPDLGRPLHLVSDAIRGFVIAAPGHEFLAVDYISVEGVVNAWMSGEHWKLQALREIMADPSLPDMYVRTAARLLNLPIEAITKALRLAYGKIPELALGYASGIAGFMTMAAAYGTDLNSFYAPVWSNVADNLKEKAIKRYERCLRSTRDKVKTDVLSREAWLACEVIKLGWRETNSAISGGWKLLGDAVHDAVANPGQKFEACRTTYMVAHGYLWARLPSGRCLAYGAPRLSSQVWAKLRLTDGSWSDAEIMLRSEAERLALRGDAKIEGDARPSVTALGVNSTTRKYERFALYDGLACENNAQAISACILRHGMKTAETGGFPIVMHNYDEAVTEVRRGGDLEEFKRLICDLPDWAPDLPLSGDAFRAKRYAKH